MIILHIKYIDKMIHGIKREAARIAVIGQRGTDVFLITSPRGSVKFPGGGVDEGESVIESASRELNEELGILLPTSRFRKLSSSVDPIEKDGEHGLRKGDLVKATLFAVRLTNSEESQLMPGSDAQTIVKSVIEDVANRLSYKDLRILWRNGRANL